MSFGERLRHFLIFVVLAVITLGIYPLYFMVSTVRENNQFLREIRDILLASAAASGSTSTPASAAGSARPAGSSAE